MMIAYYAHCTWLWSCWGCSVGLAYLDAYAAAWLPWLIINGCLWSGPAYLLNQIHKGAEMLLQQVSERNGQCY